MNVLMILSNPFLVDPRVHKEARALVEANHEVAIIVWDRKHEYEDESVVDGIRIVRIHDNLAMKLMKNDLIKNPFWWRASYKKAIELFRSSFQFDVVHCHDLDTLQAGVWLKKKLGCKLIYDAHEIFGYMIDGNVPSLFVRLTFYLEKKLVKHVDAIITVNEKVKQYFTSISSAPVTLVMNCKEIISKEYRPPKNQLFTVCYIGNLHRRRFFPEIIDILGEIEDIRFIIAAKKENLPLFNEVKKAASRHKNITFLGEIPSENVIPVTFEANVIIQPFDPSRKTARFSTPNKLFEAMVCGRPIISTKGTNPGRLVEQLQCGLAVEYTEESFRQGVITLRDDPDLCEELGRNGLQLALEKYNWDNQRKNLLELYEHM